MICPLLFFFFFVCVKDRSFFLIFFYYVIFLMIFNSQGSELAFLMVYALRLARGKRIEKLKTFKERLFAI